ncbi:hypothetical protein [Blastococcus sp. TF02-09]|uniref:hypothetical protein n=1 Tax=Blastococcus sp. TF02-09 TaxID=2250576 RepID=UPI0013149A90|nr:hypothetical protein [Blastococcus sp. TF02-9]
MWVWITVAVVVIALVFAVWVANAYRLAKKNKSLIRRSTGSIAPGHAESGRTGHGEQGL